MNGRVVVVDDELEARTKISNFFKERNCDVTDFESATHTLRQMEGNTWCWIPSLVVTDIAMDGIGGYQLIRRIYELYPNKNVIVIVVSKHFSSDYVYEAEVAGASKFLKKTAGPQ